MELANEFQVPVPADEAWGVLTDIERIAPCMPGAQLTEVVDDEYLGVVKVKVGPITATYKGKASFLERDDVELRAILQAEGRETRGQGNARATITAQLSPTSDDDRDSTTVSVVTDLAVSGRIAQFGRGVLAEVSSKLLTQFAECLEQRLQDGAATDDSASDDVDVDAAAPPAADLLDTAAAPVVKRLLPIAAAFAAAFGVVRIVRRRWRRRRRAES